MFERFDEHARRSLFFSRYVVTQLGGMTIAPEHLVLGVLKDSPSSILRFARGPNAGGLTLRIEEALGRSDVVAGSVEIPFAQEAKGALQRAATEADDLKNKSIRPEHLVLGVLVATSGTAARVLQEAGVEIGAIRDFLRERV